MEMRIYSGRNNLQQICKQRANNSKAEGNKEEASNRHRRQAQPDKDKHPDKDNHRLKDSNSREGPPTCRP